MRAKWIHFYLWNNDSKFNNEKYGLANSKPVIPCMRIIYVINQSLTYFPGKGINSRKEKKSEEECLS